MRYNQATSANGPVALIRMHLLVSRAQRPPETCICTKETLDKTSATDVQADYHSRNGQLGVQLHVLLHQPLQQPSNMQFTPPPPGC